LFAGNFELDDAEYICGDNGAFDVLDTLTSLVDKSIVIRDESDGTICFRMLDIVREYGHEKLALADHFTQLRERHRDWYERRASTVESEWIGPRQLQWISRTTRELPNYREALEFGLSQGDASALRTAAALFPYWLAGGLLTEGRRWIDRALDQSATHPTSQRIRALYAATLLAGDQGDFTVANAYIEQMRVIEAREPDHTTAALAATAEEWIAVCSGDRERARICLRGHMKIPRTHEELRLQVEELICRGWVHYLLGETSAALASHRKVLDIADTHGECVNRNYALWASGVFVWRDGDRNEAKNLLESGLRLTRRSDDPVMAFLCLQTLAWIAAEQDDGRRGAVMMGAGSMGMNAAISFALGEPLSQSPPKERTLVELTQRERQVAGLVAEGLTNNAIAERLTISRRTAQGHVEHILTKLGYTSRAQIAAWVTKREHESGKTWDTQQP
jgi:serine/threonine-protein kinase PknK